MVEGNRGHHLSVVPYLGKILIWGLRGNKCQDLGFLDIFSKITLFCILCHVRNIQKAFLDFHTCLLGDKLRNNRLFLVLFVLIFYLLFFIKRCIPGYIVHFVLMYREITLISFITCHFISIQAALFRCFASLSLPYSLEYLIIRN